MNTTTGTQHRPLRKPHRGSVFNHCLSLPPFSTISNDVSTTRAITLMVMIMMMITIYDRGNDGGPFEDRVNQNTTACLCVGAHVPQILRLL